MDHATLEPTLDDQRTDQLRTFLTVEAAADAASGLRSTPARRGRRLVGGIAAAAVLGGGLFAVASVAGGPSSGPVAVQSANAVAIESAEPGWTRISIADIDADPDAVVAELQAAGIAAERRPLGMTRDDQGRVTLESMEEQAPTGGGFTMVGLGSAGDQGFAGLTISAPDADPSPLHADLSPEEAEVELDAYLAALGARADADGSIEVRNDADVTVIVLTED